MRGPFVGWDDVFDEAYPKTPASPADIDRLVGGIDRPLSAHEVGSILSWQKNPFPPDDPLHGTYRAFDPAAWALPHGPLPAAYLSFLRWSNGGSFRRGERWFDGFFAAMEVRRMLIDYHVPQYMPLALPFAFDGGGNFFAFDMRSVPPDGEYPVLAVAAGNLGYGDAATVADSFLQACLGMTAIASLL